jgi:hypothetical protein
MLHRSFMRRSALKILGASVRFLEPAVSVQHVRWELSGAEPVPGWNVPDVRRGIFTMVLVRAEDHWLIAAAQNTDIVPLPEAAIEVE